MLARIVAALLLWAEGPPARIHFVDVARQAGVVAEMRSGDPAHHWIPEANGTGVAWLDYDGDGWFDLLLVGGADMDVFRAVKRGETPPARKDGVYLYRNLRNGKFEDVTERAGLMNPYWGTGANTIDYDNDGHTDILITTIGRDLLFHNNGNGTFTEKGAAAGLTRQMHWHTGSAFGDYDGDGFPDLYIAGYVALDALEFSGKPPVCLYRGVPGFCGPMSLKGEADILYHNNGDGTFTDVTAKAGVVDKGLYHGFTAVFHDFNGDGRPDIFVANDSNPNYLYLNQGDGTFREAALVSGVGFNEDGQTMANMGVALGDYDNDGLIDFLTTVFSEDHFPLFRQVKAGLYEEVSASTGLAAATSAWVGWSCGFADFDNDGDRDLWMANGHVYPNAGMLPTTTYLEPFVVMENRGGKFVRVSDPVDQPRALSHRGGAAGDFNNDGKVDVAVVPVEGAPLLLKNESSGTGGWVGFHLVGGPRHRDGLGASIRIEGCGREQTAAVFNGGSYLSRNDPRVHFGLGACEVVDRAVVRWPGGKVQTVEHPALNRYHSVVEPQ